MAMISVAFPTTRASPFQVWDRPTANRPCRVQVTLTKAIRIRERLSAFVVLLG